MNYEGQIDRVIRIASEVMGISQADMKGRSRKWHIAHRRFVAMKAVRMATGKSYSAIAGAFGKDHTTVIHGVGKADQLIRRDVDMAEHFHEIMVRAGSVQNAHRQIVSTYIDRSALI